MNEPLRPLNLGEILDRTVNLYRSRFLVYLGISIIPTGTVLAVASMAFLFFAWWGANGAASASPALAGAIAVIFLAALGALALPIVLAVTALATAAMSHAANRAYLGEKITIRDAYKGIWKRGWRYIWLYLLQAFIVWVAPFTVWLVLFTFSAALAALAGRAGMGSSFGAVFVLLTFLVVGALFGYFIWMLLLLCLAFPACVVEQIPAWAALKRSAVLSKGTRGRVFLLYLLGTVLGWLLSGGVTLLATIVLALIPGTSTPQRAQTTGMIVIFVYYGSAFAVQALTKPVYGIALVLFYYDQRIRQEGFDIEWMMEQAGLVVPAPPAQETGRDAQPWLPSGVRAMPAAQLQTAATAAIGADSGLPEGAVPDEPLSADPALLQSAEPPQAVESETAHATFEESL